MNHVTKCILKGGADSAALTLSEPVELLIKEFQTWVGRVGPISGRYFLPDNSCGKGATADTDRKTTVRKHDGTEGNYN